MRTVENVCSPPRLARRPGAAIAVLALLAGGLSGCGDSPDDTTCGELLDMSSSEQVAFVKDAVADEANQEEREQIEKAGDAFYPAAVKAVVSACDGKDADTKLGDIVDDIDPGSQP